MTANDKIKTLYDALSKDYDLGGYADFSQKMTDEGKRRLLFDAISGTYDVGDWDTFNAKLGGVKQPPCHLAVAAQPAAPAATTTAVAAPATPAATPDAPAEDKTDTVAVAAPDAPAAPVAQKPVAPVTPAAPAKPQVDVSLLGPEKAEGPDEAPVPVLSKPERHVTENGWDKPEWGGTELPGGATEAEEKPTDVPLKYGDELLPEPNDYQKALMGARMEGVKERGREIVEEAEKKLANMEEYRSKTHGAGGGIPLKSHTVLGEDFKPVETWITPQGNRYTDKADAELECFNIRNMQADMTTGGQLAHARARLRYMEERYDEVLGKKMEEETMAARPINVSAEILPMDYVTMDSEVQSYHTAVKNLKEQIRKLEHMQEGINKQDSFWDNFGRNFWEKFTDVGVWDGGKSDMMQSNASMIINNKIRRGKKLTEAEESALYEMYLLQGLEGYEGHGAAMGEMAGEMAPYILEFILTGGGFSGLTRFAANATAKVATRSAARMLARGAARAAKDATKSLGMKIATEGLWKTARSGARGMVAQMLAEHGRLGTASILATKGFGTLAEHMLVRSPLMAVTIQNQKLASEIIDTKLGPVEYDEENGELRFSNDKGWGQAAWEAGASRIFENASEMISPELPGVATLAEMFGAKRLAGLLTRATGEGLGGSFGKMRNFFVKKMGLGNVVEEGMEEEYKQLLDTIADLPSAYEDGDMKTKNNFDSARFHIDVWGGMLITMGVPTAAHMTAKGSYGAAEYGARKFNMSRYSNKCEKLFGKDRWAEMRLMFDAAEMDELVDLATHAYTDKTLSEEQRKAVMNYIGSSFKLKGHNLGMRMLQRARTDGSAVRDENGELVGVSARDEHEKKLIGAVRAAYLNGLDSAIDERSMRAAAKMYKNRLAKLAEAMGRSEEEAGRLAEELFEKGNSEGWSKDVVSAAYDYVIAKNVIAGMRQGERDYMAMVESAARDEVEEMTHKGDGMIHPVFMPDPNGLEEDENEVKGTTVYVVSGNLGVTSDGAFVSSSQSDQALMIWNPQTGQTEMTDAKKLSHAMPAMDAAEHLSEITQSRRAEAEQWFERGRRGEVSPAEGMKFVVNGKVLTIARGADGLLQSNNGMVNVSDGKSIFEISIDELQAAYDAELENDIKNWEEAKYGDAANGQNEAAPAPADDKSDPKPVGTGVFGAIYDQFRGKAKSAVEFLRRIKSGEAVGALHHDEIGDISIVWGNEKYGLAHILLKHGEIAEDIQVAISGMRVVQASENRIVLESDTHKAVVSKMLGQEKTPQWLLTAYEKKSASGGSSDIVPEPKGGKQNGTAPLQDNSSAGKGTEESANSNNDEHDVEKPLVVGDEVEFEEDGTMMRGMVVEVSADGVTVDVEGADGMPIPYLVDKGKVKRFREPEDKKNGPNEPPAGAAAGGSAALEDSAESSGGMAIAEQDDLAQSEDIDDNGKPFVVSSDGTTIFGEITKESGLNPAPIKLSTGFNKQDEKGNNIGYGLLHIEAGHGEQIRKAGYNSVEEFVEFVTRNYTEIKISRSRSGNQTYMLLELHDEKHKNTLYVELSRDGAYWNVNSGGIFKNKYTDKNDTVWPVPTVGSNANTDAAEVVDSPTEIAEGETVDRGGDSSHAISAGKGTENSPAGETAPAPTALARVPRDEGGKPKFEDVDAETAWDALEEMMGDSGAAGTWVAGRVKSAQKAVDAAKRALSKQKHDDDPMAYMEARKTLADAVVAAERVLKHWQDVAAAREGKAARIAAEEQRKRKEAAAMLEHVGEEVDDGFAENSSGQPARVGEITRRKGVRLSEKEAEELATNMENNAEMHTEVELTPESWSAVFDEHNSIDTPLGRVKMGGNQIAKFQKKNRPKEFGMVGPTLSDPDVIVSEASTSADGNPERGSSYLFIKTFNRNGEKIKFYASITVQKDGMEVSVSSHYVNPGKVRTTLRENEVLYIKDALLPNSSELRLAEHQNDVPDLLPTQGNNASSETNEGLQTAASQPHGPASDVSEGKGTAESLDEQKDGVANEADAPSGNAEAASGNAADATPDGGKRYSMAEDLEVVNTRFNAELERYSNGEMAAGEMFHLGLPSGAMRQFLPSIPIVMRQRVMRKGTEKKHNVDVSALSDFPAMISSPIMVFSRSADTIGVLTEMKDRDGKNVCVAIEISKSIQDGGEILEVNDIRSFHGREAENVLSPMVNNKTLRWVDKEKALAWLSSASQQDQQEITKQELETAAKVVEEFENPALEGEKIEQTPSAGVSREAEAARVEMEGLLGVGVRLVGRDEIEDETKLGALGWYDTRTGEVCVVAEHVTRAEDMRRVILHEVVGHKGLRGVLGARFGEFCGRVFSDVLGEEDRGRMAEYYWDTRSAAEREALLGKDAAGKRWGELGVMERARMMASDEVRAGAADEWLARMAEGGAAKPGMWQRLKTMLKEFLAKLGIGMKLTNGDVRVMLHRSAAALRSGKVSERTAASGLAYMMKRDLEAGVMRNVGEKYWNSGMSKAVNDAKSVDELRESMNGMADGYLAKFAEKRAVLSPKRARAQVATLTAQDGHSMRLAAARAGVEFKADAEQYTEEEIGKMVRPVEDLLTENRREVAGKWREALEGQDAAARYLVARALAKYVKDESEGCPIGYFEQPFRETMARFSASGDPVAFNFYQEYNKSLLDMISEDEDAIVEVVSKDGVSGTWVKMRKASESDDEAMTRAKVSAASQGTSWCTRHADVAGTGAHKVILEDDHDFYVFIPRGSGQAEIAIVPVKEGEQGQLKNNPWYTGIFKRTNASDNSVDTNLYEAINTLAKESKDADLVRTLEWLGYTGMSKEEMAALRAEKERGQREFLAARERITAEDIDEVQRLFGVRLNETSEGLSLHEFNSGVWEQAGEEIRDEFWQKVFESIVEIEADADFWDCNVTSLGNLERIGGDATFRGSQVADLGNLREIGGNATFRGSQVADLGNLREIGGNATFRSNQVTSLGNLETIGGYADFSGSQVTSLGNLETIGGYAYFRDSQVTDLGNLREIGVNAWFSDSQVRSLGNLETIGGSADFRDSQVTDLGNLREIGGNAWFSGSQVRSLGNLREIGGSADFRDSQVTDLVDLREIGGNATFSGSQVTSLGSLETIGWRADFSESQVADLGKLREIGGKATFGYSSDLEAQWKARRGGAQLAVEDREVSEDDRAAGELALELLAGAGVEVSLDAEEMAEALGGGAQMAAKLNRLAGASGAIHSWLKNNKRGKVFTIELPRATQEMVRRAMGKDFDSHNITANGVAHAKNNHGVGGRKVTATSIPLRDEDFELIPYIMTAPDRVEKASTDITGRTSVRFYKNLSNGYVVVAEKEYKDSPQDMETITMWAEKSSTAATNARSLANAPDTLVRNAILSMEDAAKIRQDAERAIARDELTQMMMVYHGSGAEFDAFDHSHMGDGAKNYVIFNEEDAKITNRVQFLKTGRGEVYGFVKHGKIYLDAKLLNGNTPVHEYTHLWDAALRKKNPELWKRGVELMRQSPLWEQVVSSPAYADIVGDEDLVASEVHARLTGAEGETLLKQMMAEAKSGQDGVLSRAEKMSLVHKLRAWVREAWQWVRDTMMPWTAEEASGVTLEDFVRMPVADLVAGKKLAEEAAELADVGVQYSIREKPAPRKTGKGYKVFVVKNGKLYPPKVANPGGAATPVEEWLDADAAPVVGETKTGRQQVKAGGKGTQGGSGTLAYRPGWHLGVVPFAKQFNRKNEETGERELFPSNFVWAEVDYAADTDYSEESYRNGVNKNGKYQHSLAGLKRMPVDGSYRYRTNVDPTTDDWIITGAMRVNRLLTPSEVDEMVRADGRDPQRRQDGALTDADVEKLNEELFGPKGPRGGGARTSTAGEIEAARKVKPFGEYADVKRRYPSAQRAYHEMITDLFANENADKSKYARTYFHVADTPAFMKEIGLGGAEFTIPFKQISSHMGKDADHRMTMDDWHRLPEALANPFLITRYDGKSDRFRIYTKMEVNGKYVVVGVDVKRVNKGKNAPMLEVNSIKTVFAKSNSVGANEEIVCYDENITPEQLSLLDGRNSHRYPTIQELSGGKGSEKSETDNALYRERESFEAGQRLAFTENRDGTYSLEGLPGSYQDPSMAIDVWRASHPEWAAELVQEEEEQKPGKPRTLRPLYVQVSGLWSSFALPSHIKKSARERRSDEAFRVREYRRIMNAIAEMSSELGVEVTVVEDTAMLPARKAGSKGWYDRETGRVYIVMPNCRSVQDARITLAHEVVAHKGLRALLGERFDECMDFAYEHADKEIQARVLEIAQKRGMNRWDAMEEYLAGVAETMKFDNPRWQSWWAKVQQWFREALKAMHFVAPGHELSEADFRYLLQAAHDHLVDNAKVGGVRFARSWEVQHSGSELYREGEGQDAGSGSAEAGAQRPLPLPVRRARNNAAARMYEEVVQGWRYQTDEAMLDSMAGLREAMRAIMGNGKLDMADVAGFENAYLGENALSSANVAEWDVLNRENVDYLLDAVAKLAKNEEEMTALRDYLFAVHGIERNEFMARRAAKEEADEAFKGRQDKLDEMLRALTEDADDYDEKMAALTQEQEKLDEERAEMEETLYEEHRKRDYSGLTTLFRTDEEVAKGKKPSVEEAEERAKEYYEAYEKQHGASNTRYLWARMSALSHAILDKQVECGMMSAKKCEEIKGMFAHYVPLRGFDEKTTEDVYAYLPGDSHVYQKPIAVMKGRKSVADDPISNLMQMAMSGIIQGNRNKMVKQRFLNFVLNHPSNLASVSSLWLEYDEANKQWKPIFPDGIDEHESPEVVEQKMQEWDETMKALAKEHPGRYKSGRDAIAIPYRVKDKWQEQQHQIVVRRGGVPYVITINGNPRAAQAVNGLTNPDSDASGSMEVMMNEVGKVNRWLSQMFTTWRPDFVVSNFLRDAMFANTIVKPKEGKNYARAYHRNFGTSMRRIHSLLKRYEDGDLREEDGPLEKAFIEFMRGGGETGYTNMKTLEEHKADVMKRIKSRTGNRRVLDACEQLGEAYTGLSRAVENTARFAAYLTSRQMGRSVARAVYDAKEISVNFNKKGAGGKFVGANGQTWRGNVAGFVSGWARVLYVFWNAGLQGTFRNFGGVLRKAPGATLGVAATYFAWGLMQNLLLSLFGAGGGDDDDELRGEYADLPTHVRRDNAIVGRGKSYISYPLPIEYRAFFGLGELIGDLMTSKRPRDIDEVGLEVAAQFTQLLPVDMMEGGAGWRNLVPSAVKPVVEAWTNTSWTGRPIYRETPYNMEMPDWTKAYKSANSALVGGAKWLNEVTGGDDVKSGYVDLNPAVAEHLVYGYFSGPMSLIDQSVKTAETLAGARDFESRNIPILNRVWKQVDERSRGRAVNEAYEKMRKESEETRQREKGYEKRADEGLLEYAEKLNWLQNSDEYEEYLIFDDYRKEVEALYRELKDVAGDKEAEKEISDEIARLKKEAVEAVWEIKRMKE